MRYHFLTERYRNGAPVRSTNLIRRLPRRRHLRLVHPLLFRASLKVCLTNDHKNLSKDSTEPKHTSLAEESAKTQHNPSHNTRRRICKDSAENLALSDPNALNFSDERHRTGAPGSSLKKIRRLPRRRLLRLVLPLGFADDFWCRVRDRHTQASLSTASQMQTDRSLPACQYKLRFRMDGERR